MKSAFRISDRIAMLYRGKVRFEGTPDELRGVEDPVVRGFIEGRPALLETVAGVLADSTTGIGATPGRADAALARLDRIAAAGRGRGWLALGRLLGDGALVVRAEDVLAQLEILLRDFQENPRRYVSLSIF